MIFRNGASWFSNSFLAPRGELTTLPSIKLAPFKLDEVEK